MTYALKMPTGNKIH